MLEKFGQNDPHNSNNLYGKPSNIYYKSHCSNRELRIQKKLQEKSETAMRTASSRAFKRAPTQGVLPLDPKSIQFNSNSIHFNIDQKGERLRVL